MDDLVLEMDENDETVGRKKDAQTKAEKVLIDAREKIRLPGRRRTVVMKGRKRRPQRRMAVKEPLVFI